MGKLTEILGLAQARGKALARPYQGELTPQEAFELLHLAPGAKIVDVRTRAEWDWVGRVAGAVEVEWNQYPGGVRSVAAATAATEAGSNSCFNILEGFEGDKDANGHRNNIGGWRKAGLPWIQG